MSLLRPRPNRRLDRCQSWALSLLRSLEPHSLSLSPPPLSFLSSLPPPLSICLPLSLYLFAISLCASPRRVLTANNAPRDALENIHFSCRGDEKERRREAERTELLATPVRKFISESKSSQRTDSGTSTVALEFSGCLARSRGTTPVLIYPLDALNSSNSAKKYC